MKGKRGRPKKPVDKKDVHYVDNVEFLKLLIEYKNTRDNRVYERIGTIVLKIANRMILMGKFVNYDPARRNEMVSNACYYMLKYCIPHTKDGEWLGFDPTLSNNPFAYFTETTKKAFWQHINKEKEREAVFSSLSFIDTLEDSDGDYET